MKNKILVVVAHPDDEVLGVGGTILKHVKNGDEVSVLILGDGETSRDEVADVKKREAQVKMVAEKLGLFKIYSESFSDNQFDSVPLLSIVKKIETVIKEVQPSVVYTQHAYDLNIDHRLTFQAVMTACRPQPGFCVKKILTFEVLSSTEWQLKDQNNMFCPTEYVDIEKYIDRKIDILKIYKDELRKFPHPRSIEGMRVLAKYRGIEVGYKYAEAFQVIRVLK